MEELLAYVGAELKKPKEEISDELVFLINSRIKPPKPVTKDDIFVRTMFLVSEEINSYGGRFPLEELQTLVNLVIDSPVMVGHTKEKLPIARNFKAEVVQKEGTNWLKVWFYWLKSSKDAFSLKENIDHGIYKECSLGFVFEFPQCSICGEDMRRCQHVPFKAYNVDEDQGAGGKGQEARGQGAGARDQGPARKDGLLLLSKCYSGVGDVFGLSRSRAQYFYVRRAMAVKEESDRRER